MGSMSNHYFQHLCMLVFAISVVAASVTIELGEDDCEGDTHGYSDDSGYIETANYPGTYPANCQWTIIITTLSRYPISLQFQGLGLSSGDELHIYDNKTGYSNKWVQGSLMPATAIALSNTVSVRFSSDSSGQSTGVRLHWTDIKPNFSTTPILPSDTVFRDVVPGSRVYLQSDQHPNNYNPNLDQNWILQAPLGERIIFIFKYFKTDLVDKLRIYSGEDRLTEELIGEYSGNRNLNLPPALISPTHWVHVRFTTNNYLNYKGFSIEYFIYETSTDPPTTEVPVKTGMDPAVTAVIVVLLLLCIIVVAAVLIYCFWYKPKNDVELAEQAAHYANKNAMLDENGVVIRPTTARPGTARLGTARPGTASRPHTVIRPTTSANSRPFGQPGSPSRPETATRAGTAHLRVPIDRPGTSKRGYGSTGYNEATQPSAPSLSPVPMADLVNISRQRTMMRALADPIPQAPQILVVDSTNGDYEEISVRDGKMPLSPTRLPPLGGKLPPLGGSSLPPINSPLKMSGSQGSSDNVPKLDLSSDTPRSYNDGDNDSW